MKVPSSVLILILEEFRRAIGTGQGFVPIAVSCMRFRILGTYDNTDASRCNWSDSDNSNCITNGTVYNVSLSAENKLKGTALLLLRPG